MRITKCDNCKKIIDGESVSAGFGILQSVELCVKCGQPILRVLKKYDLLPERKKELLKSAQK